MKIHVHMWRCCLPILTSFQNLNVEGNEQELQIITHACM